MRTIGGNSFAAISFLGDITAGAQASISAETCQNAPSCYANTLLWSTFILGGDQIHFSYSINMNSLLKNKFGCDTFLAPPASATETCCYHWTLLVLTFLGALAAPGTLAVPARLTRWLYLLLYSRWTHAGCPFSLQWRHVFSFHSSLL